MEGNLHTYYWRSALLNLKLLSKILNQMPIMLISEKNLLCLILYFAMSNFKSNANTWKEYRLKVTLT